MSVAGIAHLNITAPEEVIEACRGFYVEVLGLTEGLRPPFRSRGYWLYANGHDLVHLTITSEEREQQRRGALNHIALACDGLDATLARLEKAAIAYRVDRVPGGESQLFLSDPAGVPLELNFRE